MGRGDSSGVTLATGRWQGKEAQETIAELERRLATSKQSVNGLHSVIRAALVALEGEAPEDAREQAKKILKQGQAEHSRPASKKPKRNRRRVKRQTDQAEELAASV